MSWSTNQISIKLHTIILMWNLTVQFYIRRKKSVFPFLAPDEIRLLEDLWLLLQLIISLQIWRKQPNTWWHDFVSKIKVPPPKLLYKASINRCFESNMPTFKTRSWKHKHVLIKECRHEVTVRTCVAFQENRNITFLLRFSHTCKL